MKERSTCDYKSREKERISILKKGKGSAEIDEKIKSPGGMTG